MLVCADIPCTYLYQSVLKFLYFSIFVYGFKALGGGHFSCSRLFLDNFHKFIDVWGCLANQLL